MATISCKIIRTTLSFHVSIHGQMWANKLWKYDVISIETRLIHCIYLVYELWTCNDVYWGRYLLYKGVWSEIWYVLIYSELISGLITY